MSTPLIKFTDFSFRYLNLGEPSLKNINLEIFPGEKVLIIGRSGSGKSTLLQCLNGLIPHSYPGEINGSLQIEDLQLPLENIFTHSCKVGTILQDQDAQFIGLTVSEDIAFSLENNAIARTEMLSQIEKSLSLVGMSAYQNHSPYELSGGQKQHIALAGILASSPQILLFDEPLANLDPASAIEATDLIRTLNEVSGKTIIIAEHRVEECLEAGIDRLIIMENGVVCANSTPQEILASGLLNKYGIRQPLYLDALQLAGVNSPTITSAASLTALPVDIIKDVTNFYRKILPTPVVNAKMVPPLLKIDNLSYGYTDGAPIVKDFSLKLYPGEIVSLLGNNGAGKSTLTYLISGLLKPDCGQIYFNGEELTDWGIKRRGSKIGLIMQNPNLMIIKSTVRAEVALGLTAQGLPAAIIDQKVAEILKICGLWGYRNWPISALSYGQKKRVTIASVLVLEPSLLILDEPTAGQDLQTYHEFMQFILQLANQGMTILIITHDLYLALEYSKRSIVLANGTKLADTATINILSNKEILATARLREISLNDLAKLSNIDTTQFINHYLVAKNNHHE